MKLKFKTEFCGFEYLHIYLAKTKYMFVPKEHPNNLVNKSSNIVDMDGEKNLSAKIVN